MDSCNYSRNRIGIPGSKRLEFHLEYMDTKRHFSPEYLQHLFNLYETKYKNQQLDVILCSDDNALDFLLTHRDMLFPGVPIVFCGVNDFQDSRIAGQKGITGVNESPDFKGTLELALSLHPNTRQVAVVSDLTTTGQANTAIVKRFESDFEPRIQFEYLTDLTVDQLQQALIALPQDTLVLSLSFYRDAAGRAVSIDDNTRLVAGSSPVPVYTAWDFYMLNGVLGGRVVSGFAQGQAAGRMALRILNGESADEIPVERVSPNVCMFDWEAMQRFHIRESDLPKGSIILNQPSFFYHKYRFWIWGFLVFYRPGDWSSDFTLVGACSVTSS